MYADKITDSMAKAIGETERRRKLQMEYNEKHGIVPKTIIKDIRDTLGISYEEKDQKEKLSELVKNKKKREKIIASLEKEMKQAAKRLDFEKAAELRDMIMELRTQGRSAAITTEQETDKLCVKIF